MIELTNDYSPRPNTNCTSFAFRIRKIALETLKEHFPDANPDNCRWLGNPEKRYMKIWVNETDTTTEPTVFIRFAEIKRKK